MNTFGILPREAPQDCAWCNNLTRMLFDKMPVCYDHFEEYARQQSIRNLMIECRKQQERRRAERRLNKK